MLEHSLTTLEMAKKRLFIHCTIITVNASREIITDGGILVSGRRISAIGISEALLAQYSSSNDIEITNLCRKIVIPGLINTHAHLAQSLLRGLAENLDLHDWLCSAIWPLEAAFQVNDGYVAAKLTIAEMLKSGTTTFLEPMLTHTTGLENVVRAVEESECLELSVLRVCADVGIGRWDSCLYRQTCQAC